MTLCKLVLHGIVIKNGNKHTKKEISKMDFNERQAISSLFADLQEEKKQLLQAIEKIEARQLNLLDRLRELDTLEKQEKVEERVERRAAEVMREIAVKQEQAQPSSAIEITIQADSDRQARDELRAALERYEGKLQQQNEEAMEAAAELEQAAEELPPKKPRTTKKAAPRKTAAKKAAPKKKYYTRKTKGTQPYNTDLVMQTIEEILEERAGELLPSSEIAAELKKRHGWEWSDFPKNFSRWRQKVEHKIQNRGRFYFIPIEADAQEAQESPESPPEPQKGETPEPMNKRAENEAREAIKKAFEMESTPPAGDPEKGIYTGVKERVIDGQPQKIYQLFYECPNCSNKGKRFITPSTIDTFCHDCGKTMRVRPATSKGFPHQDGFNNFFIAGDRKREEEHEPENPIERVDYLLSKYNQERGGAVNA